MLLNKYNPKVKLTCNNKTVVYNNIKELPNITEEQTIYYSTNLTDYEGNEVYEGDILTDRYGSIGTVELYGGEFMVRFTDDDRLSLRLYLNGAFKAKVVGHIYDTPEIWEE